MNKKKKFESPDFTVSELSHALYETSQKLNQANIQLHESNALLNRSNEDLKKANDRLIHDQEVRLRFYSNISHDLRAPITAISNFTEYLLSQFDQKNNDEPCLLISDEELYQTLSLMSQRTEQLKQLINDVFLLSSLEISDKTINLEPINVGFFLEDYFYMCESDPFYDDVTLLLDIPENFNYTLMMDPNLMHRVLDNLFSNAVKYSSGKPTITLGAKINKDTTPNTLFIYVQDQGIGISEENTKHIFEHSYQVDAARTPDNISGAGFGLSIVKTIVEKHHGQITCESTPGLGSQFTISFNNYIL